jgi:late competence protein required for DNA uptake (superfamily II DNA/RNA helicase)
VKTIKENVAALESAMAAVLEHCMCFRFEESAGHFMVYYPQGFLYGGCRVSKDMGKVKALETLLGKMELHWNDSIA